MKAGYLIPLENVQNYLEVAYFHKEIIFLCHLFYSTNKTRERNKMLINTCGSKILIANIDCKCFCMKLLYEVSAIDNSILIGTVVIKFQFQIAFKTKLLSH